MTEGDTVTVDFGFGLGTPLKLVGRVNVWGVPHWSCLMGPTPILISESRLEMARLYAYDDFEVLNVWGNGEAEG